MKVAIIGTRFERMERRASQIVKPIIDEQPPGAIFVTGCCPTGVDFVVRCLVLDAGRPLVVFHAAWGKHGKAAGPIRNKLLVEYADRVYALPYGLSPGSRNAIALAQAASKPCTVLELP